MKTSDRSRFPFYYELFIWLFYVCFFKYAFYADQAGKIIRSQNAYFPYAQLIVYVTALSLCWIIYYRLLMPRVLQQKKYWLLFIGALVFIAVVSIISNYVVSFLFKNFNTDKSLQLFYDNEYSLYSFRFHRFTGYSLEILFPDLIAFSSIGFMRFAFENEQKKRMLEQQNFQLQLNTLKAQINPHFLFNTLNTIYGKSLANSNETPDSILRLSDMMRYVLYETDVEYVSMEKEIAFIENFLVMEKQRFADMQLYFSAHHINEDVKIAPLVLLPFAENSIKHGAQHIKNNAFIQCNLSIQKNKLHFSIENEVVKNDDYNKLPGGVGLKNVKARLQLYYPQKHSLVIADGDGTYKVNLVIDLS